MGLFSILPESLQTVETWLIRIFFLLAVIIGGPWLLLLAYDIILYIWRSATFELPHVGGRARGRNRPRAPSLKERPDGGHRRHFSLGAIAAQVPLPPTPTHPKETDNASTATGHKRNLTATMSRPIFEFVDDDE
ncbi:hypothetical protein Q7P37_003554 [Cladosporium fusiforme]